MSQEMVTRIWFPNAKQEFAYVINKWISCGKSEEALALLIVAVASNHLDTVVDVLSTGASVSKTNIAPLLDECVLDCWTTKYLFEVRGMPATKYALFANALSLLRALNKKKKRKPISPSEFVEILLARSEIDSLGSSVKIHSLIRQFAGSNKA